MIPSSFYHRHKRGAAPCPPICGRPTHHVVDAQGRRFVAYNQADAHQLRGAVGGSMEPLA